MSDYDHCRDCGAAIPTGRRFCEDCDARMDAGDVEYQNWVDERGDND